MLFDKVNNKFLCECRLFESRGISVDTFFVQGNTSMWIQFQAPYVQKVDKGHEE